MTSAGNTPESSSVAAGGSASPAARRQGLEERLAATRGQTSDILLRLLAVSSENPPGDTTGVANEARAMLECVDGIEVELVTALEPIVNVLAVIRGARPGRRLVFSGHLDTFAIGDASAWTTSPHGELRVGRIYGRGAADMKGGLAAQILAALRLAELRGHWCGELVLALTGDEETAGPHGTEYLLDNRAAVRGDAMMCADAGSPQVLRFGEKGLIWLTVEAEGRASHGAHVHLGVSAIDRLLTAISTLRAITRLPVAAEPGVVAAIDAAADVSERICGAGETSTLKSVTMNVGSLHGGSTRNLVADHAEATVDIRLPAGVLLDDAKAGVEALIGALPGVRYRIDSATAATITDPGHEIVRLTAAACAETLGREAVATMRVGSSDSVLFRERGIASVVCGLTPYNMGAADEYVLVDELLALADIYALSAFDYLAAG